MANVKVLVDRQTDKQTDGQTKTICHRIEDSGVINIWLCQFPIPHTFQYFDKENLNQYR